MNTAPSQYGLVAALQADYETRAAAHRTARAVAATDERRRDRFGRRMLGRPAPRVAIGHQGHAT